MKCRSPRFRRFTLAGLMAIVAGAALLMNRVRPLSETEAVAMAFAALRESEPVLFRSDPPPQLRDFRVHVSRAQEPLATAAKVTWWIAFTSSRHPIGVITVGVGRPGWFSKSRWMMVFKE